jgi:hypothetical protein
MELHPEYGDELRTETPVERADRNWNEILQEARVIQTCTQIIGGFLLAVAFQPRFSSLDEYQLTLYLILVALAGVATALGLALVVMHRRLFGKRQKLRVVRIGNRLLICNLIVVSVLAALVTSLIFDFAYNRVAGLIALVVSLLITLGLWMIVPLIGGADEMVGDEVSGRGEEHSRGV